MGVVDVVLIVFILVFAFKGTINGFITEAISILGIILAVLCSYMLYEPLFKVMQAVGFGKDGASIGAYITEHIIKTGEIDTYVKDIETRQNDPYTVVNTIMDNMLKK